MIVMALFNPVAFLLMVGIGAAGVYGAEAVGYTIPEDAWWPVITLVAIYLVLCWILPEKLNPWYYVRKISPRRRHEMLWGKESAAKKYDPPGDPSRPPWLQG